MVIRQRNTGQHLGGRFWWPDDIVILIETHLWRYALYRAYLNLVGEAAKLHLGWLWWFLEPIAMTAVLFAVFTFLRPMRGGDIENFAAFLIIGVTIWLWFANAVGNCTDVLVGAGAIVSQMRLPKLLFPTIAVASASLKQGFVFVVLLLFIGGFFGMSWTWLFLPLLAATQLVIILATAAAVAFVCCCIRDVRFLVRSGLTLMMFCSGLFFAIADLAPEWHFWFRLNPMAMIIEQYRAVLLHQSPPDVAWCLIAVVASALCLVVLKWLYQRFDRTLTRRIIA